MIKKHMSGEILKNLFLVFFLHHHTAYNSDKFR